MVICSDLNSDIKIEYVILESARKHGISDEDMIHVFNSYLAVFPENDDEDQWMYVGFDISGRSLEVVTIEKHENKVVFIHAMKATKTNLKKGGLL